MKNIKEINKQEGFTLVEMLVVVTIIVMLIFLGVRELWGSTGGARDAQRMKEIQDLELAIRLYHEENGFYPEKCASVNDNWVGVGPFDGTSTWGDNCTDPNDDWIIGLVPEYLPELPTDPKYEDETDLGYIYNVADDRQEFKVINVGTVEKNKIESNADQFSRCAESCNVTSYPACTNSPSYDYHFNTYAVYSEGWQCN